MSGTLTAELQRSLPDLVWLVRRLQLDAQAVLAVAGAGQDAGSARLPMPSLVNNSMLARRWGSERAGAGGLVHEPSRCLARQSSIAHGGRRWCFG
jgi:hypothetical protein